MKREEAIDINRLNDFIEDIDLYLCSASFEDRCHSVSDAIDKSHVKLAAIVHNIDAQDSFVENLDKLHESWDAGELRSIPISFKDPNSIAEAFGAFFSKFFAEKRGKILLDCTTFTHEGLLIVLKFLDKYRDYYSSLDAVYVCAEEYSHNTPNDEDKWLTKGIKSISTVLGYPGISNPAKKNHLVVLFGFELERTIKLIDHMDFDRITLCFGSQSNSIKTQHYKINKERHEELLSIYPNAEKLEISLRDPWATKNVVLNHLTTEEYNTVIAPMNNKISTIGIALAALDNPKIQLIYSKANDYNIAGYSKPASHIYLMHIW